MWAPPPVAASVAVEMFAEARHKRPAGAHLLVIPRLMTSMWRKQLSKDADLIFEIPVGTLMWPASQHEPLIVFVIFPFAHKTRLKGQWLVKGTRQAYTAQYEIARSFASCVNKSSEQYDGVGGDMREMSQDGEKPPGVVLREFCKWAGTFPSMPPGVVRSVLSSSTGSTVPGTGATRRRRRQRAISRGGGQVPIHGRKKR